MSINKLLVAMSLALALAACSKQEAAQDAAASANEAATELQLQGGAEVQGSDSGGRPVLITSEFLQAFLETEVVQTDRPVTLRQGRNELSAGGLRYDGQRRVVQFDGPVRAVLTVRE